MRGNSRLAEELLASVERLCSKELVSFGGAAAQRGPGPPHS